MFTLAMVSCKGGVGCTTLAASLATVLTQRNYKVLTVDFDPQNTLCMHLSHAGPSEDGFVRRLAQGDAWEAAALQNADGVYFLPFGQVDETGRRRVEQMLAEQPDWLQQRIDDIDWGPESIAIIDSAKGPCVYTQQAVRAAHFALNVVLSDAASYMTIPVSETVLEDYSRGARHFCGSAYVINQANATRTLRKDILASLAQQLGKRLVPCPIHQDEAVAEALAAARCVSSYAPQSQAAHDIQGLADWVLACRQEILVSSGS